MHVESVGEVNLVENLFWMNFSLEIGVLAAFVVQSESRLGFGRPFYLLAIQTQFRRRWVSVGALIVIF